MEYFQRIDEDCAIALLEIARRQNLTPEQLVKLGLTMGFDYEAHPNLKLFIYEHIASMQPSA
jgi:hypothetical protein